MKINLLDKIDYNQVNRLDPSYDKDSIPFISISELKEQPVYHINGFFILGLINIFIGTIMSLFNLFSYSGGIFLCVGFLFVYIGKELYKINLLNKIQKEVKFLANINNLLRNKIYEYIHKEDI